MYTGERYQDEFTDLEGCDSCSLSLSRTNIVLYRGNPRANIMIVGEAPGAEEDRERRPFIGKTGSYFINLLIRNGLTIRDLYITNAVLCRPNDNVDPGEDQLNACSEWLLRQIRLVNPLVIIAVGRIALSRLDPSFRLTRSKITSEEMVPRQPSTLRGITVIPIRHPSAILRAPHLKDMYEAHVQRLVEILRGYLP